MENPAKDIYWTELNWIDGELFLGYGWPTESVQPYFQPGPLSDIRAILKKLQLSLWQICQKCKKIVGAKMEKTYLVC